MKFESRLALVSQGNQQDAASLRPSALIPRGFDVKSAICDGDTTVITVGSISDMSLCPGCRAGSKRIHSRYRRPLRICLWRDGWPANSEWPHVPPHIHNHLRERTLLQI